MNIRKLFAILAGMSLFAQTVVPSAGVFAATYSEELQEAYDWAYSKSITTMSPIDNANMYGSITRAELAKMLSNWAMNVNGKTPDESLSCEFTDIDSVKGDLHEFIKTSCQLGLMGQGITAFRPYDSISRAEFGTALSRALWGNENEGGTPYYAKHLNALKEAGIMNQIANAESTKEIRGYVMLMLMRSEENSICGDALVKVTCAAEAVAGTYKDCPTACRDNGDSSSTVVKSGDLAVKVTPATERKALIDGKVSDLDTITLKASEKITVNSITLERFGYSTASDVDLVWLEDAYGNKISDEKSLSSSKDTVTLKIKKDYRDMEESNALTIVLKTSTTAKAGGTIGFKVTDVDASAKNLDLSDYNPYTYELVKYDGAEVTVSVKGNDKNYNYEAGEYYEVSRLKVKAGASVLALNGITLTNKGNVSFTGEIVSDACPAKEGYTSKKGDDYCTYTANYSTFDLDEFVSKVKVTADGKEVSGLKYSVTKDNEIVLSWNTIEVAINKDVQLVVSVAMEGLDEFGKVVRLVLDETGDLNAVEKKTGARVTVIAPKATDPSWKVYTFNGSKVKFVNTKLSSTIDAAQGSQDVVIAKGTVSVGEEIKLNELVFTADQANVIEDMSLTIAGETYDAKVTDNGETFTFTNVFIEKSGDLELSVDVVDEEFSTTPEVIVKYNNATASIGKAMFALNNGRYEDSREYVSEDDVSGSITISKLKIQESKGSLVNNKTKKAEVQVNENKDIEIFNGTYTAKKGTVNLDNVKIEKVSGAATDYDVNFVVTIDNEDVAYIDNPNPSDDVDFDAIEVKDGKSVNVKVVARVFASAVSTQDYEYKLTISGKDDKGNDAGTATKSMAKFAFVSSDSVIVSTTSTTKTQDVVLANTDQTIAEFIVEPDNNTSSAKVDSMKFDITSLKTILATAASHTITASDDATEYFDLIVGVETADDFDFVVDGEKLYLVFEDLGINISGETKVQLVYNETLKANPTTPYSVYLTNLNTSSFGTSRLFKRLAVDTLVRVISQEGEDSSVSKYAFDIEYSDNVSTKGVDSVEFIYDNTSGESIDHKVWNNIEKGKKYEIANVANKTRYVTSIVYTPTGGSAITISKTNFADFFDVPEVGKTGTAELKAYAGRS